MIACALPAGQTVFVADSGHEVFQTGHPGPGFLCAGGDQVQGLDPLPVVDAEAAVGVEAVVGVAPEHLRLLPLADFVDGINSYWKRIMKGSRKPSEMSWAFLSIIYSLSQMCLAVIFMRSLTTLIKILSFKKKKKRNNG